MESYLRYLIKIMQYFYCKIFKILSDKELVQLIADGLKIKEISKKYQLPHRTLESKVYRLRSRIGVKNNIELVAYYLRKKIIV